METIHVIDVGNFSNTPQWTNIDAQIREAILSIQWPPGSGSFTLYPESGKKRGEGNGVKPIKDACMTLLNSKYGWNLETACNIISDSKLGDFDATCMFNDKYFCLEWETGNISSSHRSMNKMVWGIQKGILIGGALLLPTKEMARYLTDRVGNFPELSGYFPYWKVFGELISEGLLIVYAIEQDATSLDVPKIAKGTDGRALV